MIIITGSSGGIGSSIIKKLSEQDSLICLYHTHKPVSAPETDSIKFEKLDITNEGDVKRFVANVKNELKKITVIHFATVKIDGLIMTYDFTDWKKTMDINVNGNFLVTSSLLPFMVNEKWGRIIHISSIAGKTGPKGAGAYSTSKAALEGLSKTLAKEYGRFNITSNIISLGYFEGGLMNKLSDEHLKKLISEVPSRKLGNTSNIVNAITFLIESEYVNGASIDINGGL